MKHLQNAFPPVPDSVHEALEKALKEKETMKNIQKMRPVFALSMALALVLMLAGAAYAVTQTGVLQYLVSGDATQELQSSVQDVTATITEDNIKIDLSGAVYDGKRLAIGISAENLNPEALAMLTLDAVYLNGDPVSIEFQSFAGQWLPSVFAVEDATDTMLSRNPVSGGMLSAALDSTYEGVIRGEAVFTVTRPLNDKIVVLDPVMWYDYNKAYADSPDMAADYQARYEAIAQSGVEIADAFSCRYRNAEAYLDEGYTIVNADGEFLSDIDEGLGFDDAYESAGEPADDDPTSSIGGRMKKTATITVSFTIDTDASESLGQTIAMQDIELSFGTVHFDSVFVSPLSTIVLMHIYPKETTENALSVLANQFTMPQLTDAAGNELNFASMEGESWCAADKNGIEIGLSFGGLTERPGALHFTFPDESSESDEQTQAVRSEFEEKVVIPLQ